MQMVFRKFQFITMAFLLLLLWGCKGAELESVNEGAQRYKNGKCVVFYPENNETIKAYAEGLCQDKEEAVFDYVV